MTRFLETLLKLQRGDLGRGSLLFAYLFLIIVSYVVGKVARDALFLDKFQAVQLPYADIAIALLVGLVVAGYVRIGRRVALPSLLAGSVLVFAANCLLFWWLAHSYRWPWLYPVIYVWVGIYGVMAPAQVWTLANYILTMREAKRVFGLVGSGAISGWMFGGLFSKAATERYGTEILLLFMAVFLGISAVLVLLIWRFRRGQPAENAEADDSAVSAEEWGIRRTLRLVGTSPYLLTIASIICISSFVTTIAGWQFKAIAKEALVHKDALAAFFGEFNFYAGLFSLATQVLLTSRVLHRFGIGPALFFVPVALLAGSMGVLILGTLAAAVVLKGSDQVLRYSIDKSTTELLYLPVPAGIKVPVKSLIDTVVWRLGDGLAGVTLLVFATYLHLTARQVSWITLTMILAWLAAAFFTRREYVATLRQTIREHRLNSEQAMAPVLDRRTAEIFAGNLCSTDVQEILYALSLFEVCCQPRTHPAVRELLGHPAPEVRQKAVSILAAAGDRGVTAQIEQLLYDPNLEVRTEALLYLSLHTSVDPLRRIEQLGDFPDFSVRAAMVSFLAKSSRAQNLEAAQSLLDSMAHKGGLEGRRSRMEAARLINLLPDQFEGTLRLLLADPDTEVARHAIRAVGRFRKRALIPLVIECLREAELAPAVAEVLASFGDLVVGTLRDYLSDPTVPMEIRLGIPGVLVRIGTTTAANALVENLLGGGAKLHFEIISALNKLQRDHPEMVLDTYMIETALAAELLGHYRSYQILGVLGGDLERQDPITHGMLESMKQEQECIFRLLGLLYPDYDLHSAYVGLESKDAVVHANALEFLDNVLKPQLRNILVPLLDTDISVAERIQLANQLLPAGAKMESREETVATLVCNEDAWLKSCGVYAIGLLGLQSLERELDACLNRPEPFLREMAQHAKQRLAALWAVASARTVRGLQSVVVGR